MSENREKKISAMPAESRTLGVQITQGGVVFSAAVPFGKCAQLIIYKKGSEEITAKLPLYPRPYSGTVQSVKVTGIDLKKCEYNFCIDDKIVTDPTARVVMGRKNFGDISPRGEHQVRGAFATSAYDWGENEKAPDLPYEDVVAYHLHVRGFTKQKNSKVKHKGTFLGLQEKIPYLKELGINQVILMPAYEFDEVESEESAGQMAGNAFSSGSFPQSGQTVKKLNYWGYISGHYYAPKRSYCASGRPDVEFKNMVKAFHENGMEVVMEFCFPDPVNVAFAGDCLCWWLQEYHVDGFLLRMNQSGADALAGNPFLMGCKLISDYFRPDLTCKEQQSPMGRRNPIPRKLAECNDGFKVTASRLLKGDEDQLSDFVHRVRYNPAERGVLNYITGHDGFTLMDLVSYDKKHNEANGEQNRDGAVYNYSWNCGQEGPSKKKSICQLRLQQMKNAFAMLLLAQGTPVIRAGDEFGNSQMGNNNPYCIDDELSWVDWSREKAYGELKSFVQELLAFRKKHRILHMPTELTGSDRRALGYPDVSCHGSRAWYGAFEYTNRHIGILYCGMYASEDTFLYVAYNLHWEEQKMALPNLPEGMRWKIVLDTSVTGKDGTEKSKTEIIGSECISPEEKEFDMPPRCIRVLETVRVKEKRPGKQK